MSKPHEQWKILPHGPLTKLAQDLYTVTGQLRMPLGESTRRMTVVRLTGDRLVIYSAIALSDPEMAKLEALGTPAYLIVPSDIHRMDVKAWKERYPELRVIAPPGARDKVTDVVHVDATQVDFADPRVSLLVVPGTGDQEFAMLVETETGKTLIVNDLIFNLPPVPGLAGMGLRALGFGPGHPSMPKLVRMKLVKDKAAVAAQLQNWSEIAGLERILVSHGAPIDDPRGTLLHLAHELAA